MLTLRSLSLTFLGLLTGFAAAAQSAASGPQGTTVLSWVVWWLAGVVLLMAVMTGASVTSAAQRRYEAQQADAPAPEAAAPASAPAAAPRAAVAEAAPAQVATQEEVYA
ncbi:hypothetical protein [Hymenobacter armeniacus]|uniref:Uncharacterized protein n=1 Tax=Hymenobacter armeniacus TaxID=2771358 RepID=A0ABR8JX87_9BACT|nr:hypothetical protein [Hymenobacter armeniacus]MBD2722334.1 hypothetical protein [Hymenobacter armeniacus]